MGLGVSLIIIAIGAILTWAVDVSSSGVDVNTVGVILMIVGLVGFLLSLAFWSTWFGPGYFRRYSTEPVGPPRRRRRTRYTDDRDDAREIEEIEERR